MRDKHDSPAPFISQPLEQPLRSFCLRAFGPLEHCPRIIADRCDTTGRQAFEPSFRQTVDRGIWDLFVGVAFYTRPLF